MRRTRFLLLLVFVPAAVALFFAAAYFFGFGEGKVAPELHRRLPSVQGLIVETETDGAGKHLGDKITYRLKVSYNPNELQLDRAALQSAVVFGPFRVLNFRATEEKIDSRTTLYLQEYTLQLLSGEVNKLYRFPELTVYYTIESTGQQATLKTEPAPIFIAARFPPDATDFPLKPLKGNLQRREGVTILAISLIVAGALPMGAAFVLLRRRYRVKKQAQVLPANVADLYELADYLEKTVITANPQLAVRMLYQAVRTLLERKEQIDWLSPDFRKMPSDRRERMLAYLHVCGVAYQPEEVARERAKELLREFKELLGFYRWYAEGEARP